jgi:hypothetical protein
VNNSNPAGIRQCLHYCVQWDIAHRRMGIGFHDGEYASGPMARQLSNYLTSRHANIKFDKHRTTPAQTAR